MKKISLLIICLGYLLVAGCAESQKKSSITAVPGAMVTDGTITFEATGKAALTDVDDPLARVKAEAAAATTAKANLLELIKGAQIKSNIVVADLMYQSSKTTATVMGWMSRAKVTIAETPERLAPGSIVVAKATLTLDMADLANLQPKVLTLTE